MFAWLNNVFLLKHHFIKMIVAEFFLGSLSISRAFSIERREYRTIWWNVENNLRSTSCKILFVSLFLSFTPWHFASTHLMHCNLVYAYLLGVSPYDRDARSPFDESMHQGKMSVCTAAMRHSRAVTRLVLLCKCILHG